MTRRMNDERGLAMVTAVLATFAVLMLTVVAVGFSIRSSNTSAQNRTHVQGAAWADAGIDWYFSDLTGAREDDVTCSTTQVLNASPPRQFTVTATFYDVNGNALACDPGAGPRGGEINGGIPASVLIESEAAAGVPPNERVTRVMQARVNLRRLQGTLGFGPFAVFGDSSLSLDSNTQIIGSQGNNADVYTNGDVQLDSNTLVSGSVFAAGTLSMSSNSEVKADVHASDIVMNNNTIVRGDATAGRDPGGVITMKGSSHIFGNAAACEDIDRQSTKSTVGGNEIVGHCVGPPPIQTFPTVNFVQTNWETAGYTVKGPTTCASAKSFLGGVSSGAEPAGDYVVVINEKCQLGWTSGSLTIRGSLAIFSDGGLSFGGNFRVKPDDDGPHNMFFFLGRAPNAPCDFEMVSNARIEAGLPTLVHTPCKVRLQSNSSVAEGQFFGNDVSFNSNSGFLSFVALEIPGEPSPGWDVEVRFRREVPSP